MLAGAQVTQYAYDLNGNLQQYSYPNGVRSVHGYDELNRLKSLNIYKGSASDPFAGYAYTVGATGNRTWVAELGGRRTAYGFDNRFRLKSETIAGDTHGFNGQVNYQYDTVGNRLSRGVTVGSDAGLRAKLDGFAHSYNAKDQPDGSVYYDNGNTKVEPLPVPAVSPTSTNPDQYDYENRLVNRGAGAVQIVYDGDGNRVRKTVTEGSRVTTTKYLVDDRNPSGYVQVLEESVTVQNSGMTIATTNVLYTYGNSLISQRLNDGSSVKQSFYGFDGHGSVRFLAQADGTVTDTYTYDAFGILIDRRVRNATSGNLDQTLPGGDANSTRNVYLYAGEQFHPDLGLYYNRARYLNVGTGRFWTMDTYGGAQEDPLSLHKYFYCRVNSINYSDPSGHEDAISVLSASAISTYLRSAAIGASVNALARAIINGETRPSQIIENLLIGAATGGAGSAATKLIGSLAK